MKKIVVVLTMIVLTCGTVLLAIGNAKNAKKVVSSVANSNSVSPVSSADNASSTGNGASAGESSASSMTNANSAREGMSASEPSASSTANVSSAGEATNISGSSASSTANASSTGNSASAGELNASDVPSATIEGQGHAVSNGQDAVDVIKEAYRSVGSDLNALEFDVFNDESNPKDFIVKLIIKAYRLDGGTGTAGLYRVEPSGHYTLIT
ncbi:hypothetical protein [uncultured Fructobacillus sp.]|jgi:hypothetical protein|uniref:hypothetical protein n=1 Tax=uncultured Fructobacillus sp. TaxID=591942 RepID=UPI0025972F79|nr:hypothetical protein [uncultured Fructobacillus sp.]